MSGAGEEGRDVEAGHRERGSGRYVGPSIRRYGCDAKVPNIPEVKVNRLRCVDCTKSNIIL